MITCLACNSLTFKYGMRALYLQCMEHLESTQWIFVQLKNNLILSYFLCLFIKERKNYMLVNRRANDNFNNNIMEGGERKLIFISAYYLPVIIVNILY